MEFKDYYKTLGVTKASTQKDIKQAFRKLARKHHPDVNPGDKTSEATFKDINEAYEVLGDPATRKKYDDLGANWRMYEQQAQAGGRPFSGGWPPGHEGPRAGYRTMSPDEMRDTFGDANPFSDFFTTFFGGAEVRHGGPWARAGRGTRPRHGRDVENEIELTLEDAYAGTTRRLAIQGGVRERTVDVRIPAGVSDGSRIRVSGEGEQGTGGTAAGDLYLRVRLRRHPVFERQGRDLYVTAQVPVTTAVLGGEADVPTLAGKPARLRVPPQTQNGQRFRLKGYGMPTVGASDDKGDLYARIAVQMPTHLTDMERQHYEALKELSREERHEPEHTH